MRLCAVGHTKKVTPNIERLFGVLRHDQQQPTTTTTISRLWSPSVTMVRYIILAVSNIRIDPWEFYFDGHNEKGLACWFDFFDGDIGDQAQQPTPEAPWVSPHEPTLYKTWKSRLYRIFWGWINGLTEILILDFHKDWQRRVRVHFDQVRIRNLYPSELHLQADDWTLAKMTNSERSERDLLWAFMDWHWVL